ncbi:hypothetical protein UlMin_042764 [Ulmus minor]
MSVRKAIQFFSRNEVYPFEDICLRVIKLCNSKSLKQGICVHSPVIKLGLQENLFMNNNLLSLYAKCFGAEYARQFFDEMPCRDVVSWTGLVSAFTRNGEHGEALGVFDSMINSGQCPNQFTFSSVLRSCSGLRDFDGGIRIHAYVIKLGFEPNPILLNSLIDFYAKCGLDEEACRIFRDMDSCDSITWTTIISSFVQAEQWSLALQHYVKMIQDNVPPSEYTFAKLLAASCFLGSNYGKLLHAHLIMLGIRMSLILKTALVDMYSSCQKMEYGIKVLHETPEYDALLWTSVISGFTQNLKVVEAFAALHEMEFFGIVPNSFTYSNILKACSTVSLLDSGKLIHSRVIRTGLEDDLSVGNALVDMYMKCSNQIEDGLRAFNGIASPNVISWTSLIAGLAEHGFEQECFWSFMQMQAVGVEPNSFTLSVILRHCSTMKSHRQTLELHGYIIKTKRDFDIVVGNALVDTYAALGMVDHSFRVISMMRQRDAVTYTNLATRMNKLGLHGVTLGVISQMRKDGVKMDGFSLASFLSASAALSTLETGKQLHCYSIQSGLRSSPSVSNGLVDLYWKCGCANDAHRAFEEISKPDVVSWNGFISGLALNGYISSALSAFDDMRLAGLEPDSATFVSVLFACSRSGLVDLGLEYFHSMRGRYKITPQLDHYVCLVDLLGKAGRLEDAMEVIVTLPFKPVPLIYKTLLSACKLHKNIPLAEDMSRRGLELDSSDPTFYLLLANLYEECGLSELGKKTRQQMRDKGLRKNPAQSWMELKGKVHIFNTGDSSHPQITQIHDKIVSLITEIKKRGYSYGDTEGSSHHSEKLAVAFGLLNTSSNAPIRISKNIRICSECHEFIMLVTRLIDRVIIVKDGNRIHTFSKGECSCRGCS